MPSLQDPNPATATSANGNARKANGTLTNGARSLAARPTPNKLSRPGDVAKAIRPPASRLSRPGDVAKAARPPPNRLSRPGDVARSQKPAGRILSRPGDVCRSSPQMNGNRKTQLNVTKIRNAQKRKSASPSTPAFDSDSEGGSSDGFDDHKIAKKPRISDETPYDLKRQIQDAASWSRDSFDSFTAISGADLVSGAASKDYVDVFDMDDTEIAKVSLEYPTATPREEMIVVKPKRDDYNPHDDICETMRQVLQNYFPESESLKHLDEATGWLYRLTRAYNRANLLDYRGVVDEYNGLLQRSRTDGILQKALDKLHAIQTPMLGRILNQVTARTVSPELQRLKHKPEDKRNTYGELLARFNSMIFHETGMTSSSVFLDLGSGVGNVVVQAALEVGCESHGIEEVHECHEIALVQEAEFDRRCKMWGVSHGLTNLLEGNFLEDLRLASILQRVDVVLVNNEVFPSHVNEQLTSLFLDLKDGAKIVSLKSFVPEGWHLDERRRESVEGTLQVQKKEYWSGYVSWKSDGGTYFIATKDTGRIERILGKDSRRRN